MDSSSGDILPPPVEFDFRPPLDSSTVIFSDASDVAFGGFFGLLGRRNG